MAVAELNLVPDFDTLYERIRRLPEGITGEILEEGVLRTMSRPARKHRHAQKVLSSQAERFDRAVRGIGWWIEIEAEVRLIGTRLAVPDLSGWRVSRVPEMPDENPITIVPDWACEVLSPRTRRDDRRIKLPLYMRAGIPWVWLVDPDGRTVEIFENVDGRPVLTLTVSDEKIPLAPFDEPFDLDSFWLPEATEPAEITPPDNPDSP